MKVLHSRSPEEHVTYFLDHFLPQSACSDVFVLAHAYGAVALRNVLVARHDQPGLLGKVRAMAFTDYHHPDSDDSGGGGGDSAAGTSDAGTGGRGGRGGRGGSGGSGGSGDSGSGGGGNSVPPSSKAAQALRAIEGERQRQGQRASSTLAGGGGG